MCIYKLIILNNNINLQIKKRKIFAAQKDAIEMIQLRDVIKLSKNFLPD